MVDDHSRLAYAEVLPTLSARLRDRVPAPRARLVRERGVQIQRGHDATTAPPTSRTATAIALAELGLRHLRIRPTGRAPTAKQSASSRPCSTNGPTSRLYGSSAERDRNAAALPRPLQLHATTRLPRPQTTRLTTDQPHRELQLAEIHSPLYSPGTEPAVVLRHCGRLGAVSKTVVGRKVQTEGSNPSPSVCRTGKALHRYRFS